MSNHLDPLSNPLNIETIQEIDNLDLPIMQKHHLRILAHCLQILKIINLDNSLEYQHKNLLREWCDNQSKKFDDKKFSDLFYEQLESTSKKLSTFSKKIGKSIEDLEIDDLVLLVGTTLNSLLFDPEEKIYFC